VEQLSSDAQAGKRATIPGTVHPVLAGVIEKAWRAKPEERPTAAEIWLELEPHVLEIFPGADPVPVQALLARLPDEVESPAQ
jgi:hypothetical protein